MAKRPWNFKRHGGRKDRDRKESTGKRGCRKERDRDRDRVDHAEAPSSADANVPVAFHFEPRNVRQAEAYRIFGAGDCEPPDVLAMLGPMGCGKTVVAMACAVREVIEGRASRITLLRPAVEAGEQRLGFIPGDIDDKLGPHYAAFGEALACVCHARGPGRFPEEKLRPLAIGYIRGRTFRREVVVLDEAQNCTYGELKLVLGRLGEGGRLIVMGDPEQSDLPRRLRGGLTRFVSRMSGAPGFAEVAFDDGDIVRHRHMEEWSRRLRD